MGENDKFEKEKERKREIEENKLNQEIKLPSTKNGKNIEKNDKNEKIEKSLGSEKNGNSAHLSVPLERTPNNIKNKPFICSNNNTFEIMYLNQESTNFMMITFNINNLLSIIYPELKHLSETLKLNNNYDNNNINYSISNCFLSISSYERKNLTVFKNPKTVSDSTSSSSLFLNTNERTDTVNLTSKKEKLKNKNQVISTTGKFEGNNFGVSTGLGGVFLLGPVPGVKGPNNLMSNSFNDPICIARQFAIESQIDRNVRKTRILKKLNDLSLKI